MLHVLTQYCTCTSCTCTCILGITEQLPFLIIFSWFHVCHAATWIVIMYCNRFTEIPFFSESVVRHFYYLLTLNHCDCTIVHEHDCFQCSFSSIQSVSSNTDTLPYHTFIAIMLVWKESIWEEIQSIINNLIFHPASLHKATWEDIPYCCRPFFFFHQFIVNVLAKTENSMTSVPFHMERMVDM